MNDTLKNSLISFAKVPLGHRIRYPGMTDVWTVILQYRNFSDDEPMSGTLAAYHSGSLDRASICSHVGGQEDCPDLVILVD